MAKGTSLQNQLGIEIDEDKGGDEPYCMNLAIRLSKTCVSEQAITPKVGAVIVKDDKIISAARRGTLEDRGGHAEYLALKQIDYKAPGGTIYTTLEPCTHRSKDKTPCLDRIISAGIQKIVIGMVDPNPRISGRALSDLSRRGLDVALFPHDLVTEIQRINSDFIHHWEKEKTQTALCSRCLTNTDHRVLNSQESVKWLEDYYDEHTRDIYGAEVTTWSLIECKGCETWSFCKAVSTDNTHFEGGPYDDPLILYPPRTELSSEVESDNKAKLSAILDAFSLNNVWLATLGLCKLCSEIEKEIDSCDILANPYKDDLKSRLQTESKLAIKEQSSSNFASLLKTYILAVNQCKSV